MNNQLMRKALVDAIDQATDEDVVTLAVVSDTGSKAFSNASPVGLQSTIDVLMVRMGYMLAEQAKTEDKNVKMPTSDQEAYCLGAHAVANDARDKAERMVAARKGKHVVEDVTDGAAANEDGKKSKH